jgi:cobalt-zinc-cadmium efflux system outer membrane protein
MKASRSSPAVTTADHRRRSGRTLALLVAGALTACGSVSQERGHREVAALVEQRTGAKTRWDQGPPDDARVAEWTRAALAKGLTRARAIEIALVNNPSLQATYEQLGVSQADMVQAGLLANPTLAGDFGFGLDSGAVYEARLSLVQDFLNLFVMPLRKDIARAQFETDIVRVAHQALEVAAEVEKALAAAQANVELLGFRRAVLDATAAAADLSGKQLAAGNISQLDHDTERANFEQAKLDLARAELELLEGRERLNRLLGLWGQATTWRLAEALAPLPPGEPPLEHLESLAIAQRFDVEVARRQTTLLTKAVDLARSTRFVGRLEIGIDGHRDPDGPRVLGPNLVIELPIFDQRQATIARLEAERREQERKLAGIAIDTRSEVRLAEARLTAARRTALHFRDVLVPLREEVVAQAQLHYNGMFLGLYQLLAVKQSELDARRGLIEATRDYWIARADLARAVGGRLPAPAPPAPATSPAVSSNRQGNRAP